jgi:glycosyltransferase involved in cell wall biosynthesis
VQYLIEAWNKLNFSDGQAELMLVGNLQKDFNTVLRKMPLKKNIIFVGSTNKNELLNLYNRASVFVLPSVEDGFGMVVGEAMAAGIPVICTANVGASEIIKGHSCGFIVPAADSDALAEKILWCHNNQGDLLRMGIRARKIVQNWSWSNYGNRIIEIYSQILNGRTSDQP